jgi:hypothetical protein
MPKMSLKIGSGHSKQELVAHDVNIKYELP